MEAEPNEKINSTEAWRKHDGTTLLSGGRMEQKLRFSWTRRNRKMSLPGRYPAKDTERGKTWNSVEAWWKRSRTLSNRGVGTEQSVRWKYDGSGKRFGRNTIQSWTRNRTNVLVWRKRSEMPFWGAAVASMIRSESTLMDIVCGTGVQREILMYSRGTKIYAGSKEIPYQPRFLYICEIGKYVVKIMKRFPFTFVLITHGY